MNASRRRLLIHLGLVFAMLAALLVSGALGIHVAAAQPSFDFSPKQGPPGTKVTVSVSGVPPNESLAVEGNGKELCSFTSGNNGKGGCSFKVPKGSGKISLKLTGPNVGHSDIGTFKVTNGNDNGGNQHGGTNRRGGNRQGKGDQLAPIPGPPSIQVPRRSCASQFCREEDREIEQTRQDLICTTALLSGSPLGCRELAPGGNPLPPSVENAVQVVECVQGIRDAAELATGNVFALPGVIGLALSGCPIPTRNTPIPPPPLEVAPEFPLDTCLPSQTGTVANCSENPNPQPAAAPPVPPVSSGDLPTFGDILAEFNVPTSAPSASLVQDQQDQIRNNVCARLPAGAGGCP